MGNMEKWTNEKITTHSNIFSWKIFVISCGNSNLLPPLVIYILLGTSVFSDYALFMIMIEGEGIVILACMKTTLNSVVKTLTH